MRRLKKNCHSEKALNEVLAKRNPVILKRHGEQRKGLFRIRLIEKGIGRSDYVGIAEGY